MTSGVQAFVSREGEGFEGEAVGFESSDDKGASAAAQGEPSGGGHRAYLTGGHEAGDKGNKGKMRQGRPRQLALHHR